MYRDEEPFLYDPRNVEIKDDWYKFIALDWGYRNPTAIVWIAVDYEGNAWLYDEYYSGGKVVSEVAEIIKAKSNGQKIQQYLIDPSTKNRTAINGLSIMDEFADAGLFFNPANNDVRAGINRMQEFLKPQNGYPKLRVNKNCVEWRKEVQLYRWKDLKAGATQDAPEKPIKKDDHLMDATRYAVSFLYETPVKASKKESILEKVWALARNKETADYHWMAD